MSKFKHTKGPYKKFVLSLLHITHIQSQKGEYVCSVHYPETEEGQANIKIIMAMDEMLEALIEIRGLCSHPDYKPDIEAIKRICDAANKKATDLSWEEIIKDE